MKMFEKKFEIPLTINNTEEIFDNIKEDNDYIENSAVGYVYMPVYFEDGGSGRAFKYDYNKEQYYKLIEDISKYKKVIITYPVGDVHILKKYIELGVTEFMVSNWKEGYKELKEKYGIKIHRSIVGNAYNYKEFDDRFDGIVLPYKYILNLNKIIALSKRFELTVIPNHFCKVKCENLDNHCYFHMKKENRHSNNTPYNCPEGKNFFVTRDVLLKILPYVSKIKMIGRTLPSGVYEMYMNYYMFGEPIIPKEKADLANCKTINLYNQSNMKEINCEFECETCDKKCY